MRIEITKDMSNVTKKVVRDFNLMDAQTFMNRYSISKERYVKRLMKYGDPYMKAPLARIGKLLVRTFTK